MLKTNNNVCIALNTNDSNAYIETFIQAHIQHLNAKVLHLCSFEIEKFKLERLAKEESSIKGFIKGKYHRYAYLSKKNEIKDFLKSNNIQVVLAEYGYVGLKMLNICKECNIPLVVYFLGHDGYEKKILARFGSLYKEMFAYAKGIVAVSKDMEQQLIRLGAPPAKVHYNVCGVDTEYFTKTDVLQSPPHLLAVGRFVEKKAPYLTILAFKRVVEAVPAARLIMVGDGLLFDVCKNMAKSLGIADNIDFKGPLSPLAVTDLLKTTRVFVQHSIVAASGDSEGTPVAILEAGGCGVPVVSTNHAGIKDVIIHGFNGYLVDEGDIDSMANCMIELLLDKEKAAAMGEKARQHILENYTMAASISNLSTILMQ